MPKSTKYFPVLPGKKSELSAVISVGNQNEDELLIRDPDLSDVNILTLYSTLQDYEFVADDRCGWEVYVYSVEDEDQLHHIVKTSPQDFSRSDLARELPERLLDTLAALFKHLLQLPNNPALFERTVIEIDSRISPSKHYLYGGEYIIVFEEKSYETGDYKYFSVWKSTDMGQRLAIFFRKSDGTLAIMPSHHGPKADDYKEPLEHEGSVLDRFGESFYVTPTIRSIASI